MNALAEEKLVKGKFYYQLENLNQFHEVPGKDILIIAERYFRITLVLRDEESKMEYLYKAIEYLVSKYNAPEVITFLCQDKHFKVVQTNLLILDELGSLSTSFAPELARQNIVMNIDDFYKVVGYSEARSSITNTTDGNVLQKAR